MPRFTTEDTQAGQRHGNPPATTGNEMVARHFKPKWVINLIRHRRFGLSLMYVSPTTAENHSPGTDTPLLAQSASHYRVCLFRGSERIFTLAGEGGYKERALGLITRINAHDFLGGVVTERGGWMLCLRGAYVIEAGMITQYSNGSGQAHFEKLVNRAADGSKS